MISLIITATTRDARAAVAVAYNHLSSKPLAFEDGVCGRRFERIPCEAVGKFVMSLMGLGMTVVLKREQDVITVNIPAPCIPDAG